MRIDGTVIAQDILATLKVEVAAMLRPPRLMVFTCQPNFETKKFMALKAARAKEVGIAVQVKELDAEVSLEQALLMIGDAHAHTDGIVVQLPFPKRIPADELSTIIAPSHDVDVLTYDGSDSEVLPPVVGAIEEIAQRNQVSFTDKTVVVIGHGRLVGAPFALYARKQGAHVHVLTEQTTDIKALTKTADIVVLGAGVPGLLTPAMVQAGVVVFDAGTSESNGVLAGDADPALESVASLITPVPGGIGPITIAILLRNLVRLKKQK